MNGESAAGVVQRVSEKRKREGGHGGDESEIITVVE